MKKLNIILVILILLLSFTLIGNSAWLDGWDYRIEFTIDYDVGIAGEVTWFPVTIFLKDANGDSTKVFDEVGANSRKIAITKADGETELKGEIEQWEYDAGTPANSVGIIHTSADGWVINANTSIFLYYDNDYEGNNPNIDVINTVAGAAVWDGNFKAVYHMVDDNGNVDDSTSNDNDGTKKDTGQPNEVEGKVGQGQDFDAVDDYISIAKLLTTNTFTLESWAYLDISGGANGRPLFYQGTGEGDTGTVLGEYNGGFYFFVGGNGILAADTTFPTGQWLHIVGVSDNLSLKIYVDSIEEHSGTGNNSPSDNTFSLGRWYDFTDEVRFYDGKIDEVRISDSIRTPAWIKGTFNSGNDNLLTYGSEEEEEAGTGVPITDNLVAHFDADAIEGLNDEDLIAQWDDLSVEGNHATQGTEGNRPTYRTGILDDKAIVRFTGDGEQFLRHSSIVTDNYTAFYVIKLSESADKALYYYHAGNVGGGDLSFTAEYKNTTVGWGSIGNVDTGLDIRTSDVYPTPLDWRIHTHQPTVLYKDGVEVGYSNSDDVYAGSLTDIGTRNDNAILYFVGDIAEILVYDVVLSSADRASVEQYLGEKWLSWEPLEVEPTYNYYGHFIK